MFTVLQLNLVYLLMYARYGQQHCTSGNHDADDDDDE